MAVLLGVLVASLGVTAWVVVDKADGDLGSLRHPPKDETAQREKALAAARTFVQRFNTYGPGLLDSAGKMPDYAAVGGLMTAKFRTVFDKNVGYAEETVKQTQIDRTGTPYAVGIASIDADSAQVLVAGVVEFSYPDPKKAGERIPFEPLRFRYEVSLVKQDGRWLVDDLDDVDDELPSFGEASIPQGGAPSPAPSGGAGPSGTPSGSPTGSPTGTAGQ
ncbi:hypothetical protein [Pimelobacter simplex]|uniref:hypothetical protein n=1 Tax=Nocardioides simplex TaxID=2045 RepID=UPI00214F73FB|nr:hypothetical protein [Pimelobacter simplex]UUW91802.1 hypothetical protein M0M43_10060 [Pimelobacter simplex]UUW95630.1 hypothetical protein M0M48_28560 [Pimelobacter simplex]